MAHRWFPALQSRNFRLIWIGLFLSFSGSFMQNAALLWHVSLLAAPGQKALALGGVGLVKIVPIVTFSLISGVVADTWDRRRVMLCTQAGSTIVALGLTALAVHGTTHLWPIYALAATSAAVGAFDLPARQALVPSLVPRVHLPNAISLNSMMLQLASVIGPFMGGLLIAGGGLAWTYGLNAVSFGFVFAALLMMRDMPSRGREPQRRRGPSAIHSALEGLRFVFKSPLILSTMLLDFLVTFFASATALLPIFTQDILHAGASAYGWLFAAPAVGALLTSAAMVRILERIEWRGRALLLSLAGHGLATIAFGLSRSFWLTFVCLALTGATDMVNTIIRNLVRQLETPDRLRGRMSGVNMVFFRGGPELGELEAGLVANWFGPVFSVVSGGIGCLIATAWVAVATPRLRRYRSTESSSTVDDVSQAF